MFDTDLYEDYKCSKCGRWSELCNCEEDEDFSIDYGGYRRLGKVICK